MSGFLAAVTRLHADSDADQEASYEPIADDEREELIDLMLEGVSEIFARLAPAREQALKPATIMTTVASQAKGKYVIDPRPKKKERHILAQRLLHIGQTTDRVTLFRHVQGRTISSY